VRRLDAGAAFPEVQELVAGARGRIVFETGDLDAGIWTASLAQALVQDIPSVAELMHTMVSEAEGTIAVKLARLVGQGALSEVN
jgi:NAD(P)H-dependent flavin oxidoreductase YrpB (nitropropane dioxygenase family)